jgi:hypothetical protein
MYQDITQTKAVELVQEGARTGHPRRDLEIGKTPRHKPETPQFTICGTSRVMNPREQENELESLELLPKATEGANRMPRIEPLRPTTVSAYKISLSFSEKKARQMRAGLTIAT